MVMKVPERPTPALVGKTALHIHRLVHNDNFACFKVEKLQPLSHIATPGT